MRTAIAPAEFRASLYRSAYAPAPRAATWPVTFATFRGQRVPALIVIGAVIFNALLAVVNGHLVPLTQFMVIATEMMLVLAAHLTAFMNYQPQMKRWYVLIGILFGIAVIRGLIMEDFDPKLFRDVLLIPTFILLGITFKPRGLPTLIVMLVGIDAAFMLLEAVSTMAYAWAFKI